MTKENEQRIHQWAVDSAKIVTFLPAGINFVALQTEKIKMTINVADLYGVSLTQKAAKALLTAIGPEIFGSALELIFLPPSDPSVAPAHFQRTIALVQMLEGLGRRVAQEYEK